MRKAEAYFGVDNLTDPDNIELYHHVLMALKANVMMKRDVDYVVKDGQVVIVDEFTGRSDGGPPLFRRPASGHRGQGKGEG